MGVGGGIAAAAATAFRNHPRLFEAFLGNQQEFKGTLKLLDLIKTDPSVDGVK